MKKPVMIWRLILVFLPGWLLRILSPGRERYRGQEIDPRARALGRLANFIRVPGVLPSVEESRRQLLRTVRMFDRRGPQITRVEDIEVAGAAGPLAARLYCDSAAPGCGLVYFHGGGFIQGDLETHHDLCLKLARQSGAMVISVDYRLAPEHPFPAGLDDARTAYLDIRERAAGLGLDPGRIGIGGDSAGGCFAAVLAQDCRDSAPPLFQLLIYPVTDGRMEGDSIADLQDGYILTRQRMEWYRDLHAGDFRDFDDPRFSPLRAADLSGLAPAYVLTGGFDPLWDDGRLYAERLAAAGVDVSHRHHPGQIHGFVNLTRVIPEGRRAIAEIATWIRRF